MVGPQKATERLNSPALVTALLRYINSQPPFLDNRVHRSTNPNAVPGRILSTFIIPVTFMVLDGRKIVPLDAMRGLGRPSIVQARWGAPHQEKLWVGELLKVFLPLQEDLPKQPLAAVHWLKPANSCPLRKNIWEAYKSGFHFLYISTHADLELVTIEMLLMSRYGNIRCLWMNPMRRSVHRQP